MKGTAMVRRVLAALVATALLATALPPPAAGPARGQGLDRCVGASEEVERLLLTYSREVRTQFYLDGGPFLAPAARIGAAVEAASEAILDPNADLLHCRARVLLAEAPRLLEVDPVDLPPFDPERTADLVAVRARLGAGVPPFTQPSRILPAAWNPFRAADLVRQVFLAEMFDGDELRDRVLLDSAVPTTSLVVDSAPNAPVLALVAGEEVLVVHLRYAEETGIYQPQNLEWLRWER